MWMFHRHLKPNKSKAKLLISISHLPPTLFYISGIDITIYSVTQVRNVGVILSLFSIIPHIQPIVKSSLFNLQKYLEAHPHQPLPCHNSGQAILSHMLM